MKVRIQEIKDLTGKEDEFVEDGTRNDHQLHASRPRARLWGALPERMPSKRENKNLPSEE